MIIKNNPKCECMLLNISVYAAYFMLAYFWTIFWFCLQFDKSSDFVITREEFRQHLGSENALIGKQLRATVTLLDWWWNKTSSGYDSTRVFSNEILLKFLGGKVWTFKPNTPFKIFVSSLGFFFALIKCLSQVRHWVFGWHRSSLIFVGIAETWVETIKMY